MRVFITALWLLAIGAGAFTLIRHQGTAGPEHKAPELWPERTAISRVADRPTLLMFVHPHCPCTRESLEELNRLLARCEKPPTTHVLFLQPEAAPDDWVETGTWRSAGRLPEVQLQKDVEGQEARAFAAVTSGTVVLYSPAGELLFSGGITAGRGHAGDNSGADAVVAILRGARANTPSTPVYGCPLFSGCTAESVCGE